MEDGPVRPRPPLTSDLLQQSAAWHRPGFSMSQAGKVLHLYVEVRSIGEEEGKLLGADGTGDLMLQCQEVLPRSQRSSARSSPNRSPSPVPPLNSGPSSKSSSRHSVSFQLQSPDGTASPPQSQRQDVLYDGFGQLLQVLAPDAVGPAQGGSLGQTRSPEVEPFRRGVLNPSSSTPCARLTVPPTAPCPLRPYEAQWTEGEDGRTSVVTYGYIEKSNVYSRGRHSSVCHSELDAPFYRDEGPLLPTHAQKRLSDPLWYNVPPGHGDPYLGHLYPPHTRPPVASPHLQRATLGAAARDATYRALEEFGSKELQRRFSGHGPVNYSPTLPRHHQSPRCRSWGGSPVLPRSTYTLPPRAQMLEIDRGLSRTAVNGLPRSPASDHLCGHTGYPAHVVAPPSHGPPQSQARPWAMEDSLRSKLHPHLPAGRPTDIQHEVPAGVHPRSSPLGAGHQAGWIPKHCANSGHKANTTTSHNATGGIHYNAVDIPPAKSHHNWSRCSSRASDDVSATSSQRSVSPSLNSVVASKLAVEASKMSTSFAERQTPSPTPSQAESLRSDSPRTVLRESQPYATLHGHRSPEHQPADKQNHRWKTEKETRQTRPGCISPVLPKKSLSTPVSPALPARLHRTGTSQWPVLDPRQQRAPSSSNEMSSLHRYLPPQYTGNRKSAGNEPRRYTHISERASSPEVSGRTTEWPVSWTSRQQEWRGAGHIQQGSEFSDEKCQQSNSRLYPPSRDEYRRKSAGHKAVRKQSSVSQDTLEDGPGPTGSAGTWSQSSSGVTGSTGSTGDRLSPETLSQSSHGTADTGAGTKVGSWGP